MKANLYPGRGTLPDWNNLDILQRNRMPARANMVLFPDSASCRHAVSDNRRYLSPSIINLKDGWESRFYPDILQMPESILSFRSGFDPLVLPGNMPLAEPSTAGTTAGYPFPVTPPLVPSEQPVMVCRRTCRLPLTWGGVRKRLVLQGVSAACHIFVNGKLAGYTQGSCLPAEYDVTSSLHDGDNEVFILVYPRCDGSYLEKQSAVPMSGLVREIWFEAVPAISVYDARIRTSRTADGEDWQMDLDITLISYRIAMDSPHIKVSLWLNDECQSETDWAVSLKPADGQDYASPVQTVGHMTARIQLPGVLEWNDETPFLYDLFISVEERGGHELCCVHQAVGFRQLTWQDDTVLLNGKPMQLRAAVWPAQNPAGAKPAGAREMVSMLRQLRQSHMNALYIQDFPADPILLELCDIYGMLVIDEAPADICHPFMLGALREDSRWIQAALERLERLVRRDINHPCVVLWSAGLLRQKGAVSFKLAEQLRQWDDSRPIHFVDTPDLSLELDARIAGSWAGSEPSAWPAAPVGIGQCYCRWGRQSDVYLRELRQILRPLQIDAVDAVNGAFTIRNKNHWLPASHYRVDWLLLRNGRFLLAGEQDNIRCGPGEEQFIELLFGDKSFDDGSEYLLRFEVTYAESSLWADCGDEVFFSEFLLAAAERPDLEAPSRNGGRLRLESDRHHLIVSGGRFWMVFNRINGSLESWRVGDKEMIAAHLALSGIGLAGLQSSVWRRTDFLDEAWMPEWRQIGFDRLIPQVITCQEGCDGQTAVIEMVIRLASPGRPACLEIIDRYEIRSAGDLRVFTSLKPLMENMPPVPCFSICLNLSRTFERISWYGGGPGHGLASLHASLRRGLYDGTKADPVHGVNLPGDKPGVYPGVDWLAIKDKTGFGLMIRASQLFGFAAGPAGQIAPWPGFADAKPERQALTVQLFSQVKPFQADQPVKAIWHLYPIVTEF